MVECSKVLKNQAYIEYCSQTLQRYKLMRQVQYIQNEQVPGTSIISMCLPPIKGSIERASALTSQKSVNSKNIKNKTNRQSVLQITAKLLKYLSQLNEKELVKGNGVLLYVGVFGKSQQVINIEITPPVKLTTFNYSCDTEADLKSLTSLEISKESNLYAITDGQGLKVFSECGSKTILEYNEEYFVVTKTRRGGQSSNRFMHTAQDNKHQQVKNSIDRLINVIRSRNIIFDTLFICGSESFKGEVLAGIKDSDIGNRVKIYHEISINIPSVQVKTLQELKDYIADINSTILSDQIQLEKVHLQEFHDCMRETPDLVTFGLDNMMRNIINMNVKKITISEDCDISLTQQEAQNLGLDVLSIYNDREYLTIIEILIELVINTKQFNLQILQSNHSKYILKLYGEFAVILYSQEQDEQ